MSDENVAVVGLGEKGIRLYQAGTEIAYPTKWRQPFCQAWKTAVALSVSSHHILIIIWHD